jgi:adenylate cyclase
MTRVPPNSSRRPRLLAGWLLVMLGCATLASGRPSPLDGLDRLHHDLRLRRQSAPAPRQVMLVDVDERSLAEFGRWPWPQATLALLAERLAGPGRASVVAFVLPLAGLQPGAAADEALPRVLSAAPSVFGYRLAEASDGQRPAALPVPVLGQAQVARLQRPILDWSGYHADLPLFQAVARGRGFLNAPLDPDGVLRSLPLLAALDGQVYESFALAVLREHLGGASLRLRSGAIILAGDRGRIALPLSDPLSIPVPFALAADADAAYGSGRFAVVSAADLVSGSVDSRRFAGKVVLVGSSAPALGDLHPTPFGRLLPGMVIQGALLEAALASAAEGPRVAALAKAPLPVRPAQAPLIVAAAAALVGLAAAIGMSRRGAAGTLAAGLAGALALVALDALAWSRLGWILPSAAAQAMVAALTLVNLVMGWRVEGRARRAVRALFGQYVSPELVATMTRDPLRFASMASENRELTILFADIRGFTRIAETMEPGDLRELINVFLTAMTEVIHAYGGTVDKYIGDAVMAFWGAPLDDPLHADRAVAAARAMQIEAARLREVFGARGWPQLSIGLGLNTGVARVGDMGSRLRRTYTVLGDAVNLAARIEGLTKQFDEPIIVGEQTVRQARSHRFRELAQVTVTGRSEPARLFVPLAEGAESPEAATSFIPAAPGVWNVRHEGSRIGV